MEARIAAIRKEFEADEIEFQQLMATETAQEKRVLEDRTEMSRSRRVNGIASPRNS
jgi:hypothetical protein